MNQSGTRTAAPERHIPAATSLTTTAALLQAGEFIGTVEPAAFTDAMRNHVGAVTIVTTDGPAGRFGLTVSAFSSVSAEPAMVLVCINRRSPVGAAIQSNRRFCVNLLATGQRSLADVFAGRPESGVPYDFGAAGWRRMAAGNPAFDDTVAAFDCALTSSIAAGSHEIFIGRVVDVIATRRAPLLYTNRSYGRPCIDN